MSSERLKTGDWFSIRKLRHVHLIEEHNETIKYFPFSMFFLHYFFSFKKISVRINFEAPIISVLLLISGGKC